MKVSESHTKERLPTSGLLQCSHRMHQLETDVSETRQKWKHPHMVGIQRQWHKGLGSQASNCNTSIWSTYTVFLSLLVLGLGQLIPRILTYYQTTKLRVT
ncbi:hypothetical protein V6N12_005864 [Hibiscus sabdariffa]|uniref:Uncharacterized protein n=1 Tax=Hibiscus sabdariffa TaxID=183260 RepID=A0ABR2EWQ4_9ROSI